MTKVLITGGAGFIGSHVTERLLGEGDEVVVVDNFSTARRDSLEPHERLTVVEGTIADPELVEQAFEFGPEVVLHAAASYKDPVAWAEDARTNVVGSANVVQAAERGRRVAHRLPADGALLRRQAAGAADHAEPPAAPGGVQLRDLEDGGRALLSSSAASRPSRSAWPTSTGPATSPGRCRRSTTG